MITREELLQSKEYWLERIQNDLFEEVNKYLEQEGMNQTKLAKQLGVSKSYISQILNGNFDHKLSKLIELALAVGKVPIIKLESIRDVIANDRHKQFEVYSNTNVEVKQDAPKTKIIYRMPIKEATSAHFYSLKNQMESVGAYQSIF